MYLKKHVISHCRNLKKKITLKLAALWTLTVVKSSVISFSIPHTIVLAKKAICLTFWDSKNNRCFYASDPLVLLCHCTPIFIDLVIVLWRVVCKKSSQDINYFYYGELFRFSMIISQLVELWLVHRGTL